MGTKTIIMLCFVGYRIYAYRKKPVRQVNFSSFLQKGGKVDAFSVIR